MSMSINLKVPAHNACQLNNKQIMITKITTHKLFLCQPNIFWFSKLTQVGHTVVAELPDVSLPVRSKADQQDRFSKKNFFQVNSYRHKDKPPRCRYYALEYKNRIYHVFDAYYYPMGRMIGKVATAIRGKNSPLYRNSQADVKNGDICVILNATDPLFTGKKLLYKELKYHTGFVGHLRTYSYRHVLNTKPQLLYYYLLRKFMPKNKLSAKYLQNLRIYRGPTHDIPHLPQFAPDQNIYQYLPQANLQEYIKYNPDVKIVEESRPGLAKETLGRDFEYVKTKEEEEREYQEEIQKAEDTSKLHKRAPEMKERLAHTKNQIQKLQRRQKRFLNRYKEVRAPYKAKNTEEKGFLYIKDERKARKMEEYKTLVDEDLPEEDEEAVDDPFGRKAAQAAVKAADAAAKKAESDNKK